MPMEIKFSDFSQTVKIIFQVSFSDHFDDGLMRTQNLDQIWKRFK